MSWVKDFRKETGISQTDLAIYLGIPRTTLAMAESKQRPLPSAAHLKLALLQAAINKPEIKTAIAPTPPSSAEKEMLMQKLEAHSQWLRSKAWMLEKKIKACDERMAQHKNFRKTIDAIKMLHQETEPGKREQRWLDSMQSQLETDSDHEAQWEQQYRQLQHDTLLAEAQRAEQLLEEMRGE